MCSFPPLFFVTFKIFVASIMKSFRAFFDKKSENQETDATAMTWRDNVS